ncbi:MAG: hypothetical protein M9887_05925 [Chitinophagales bacterium]|nr:hypothetical protein [Chitinophagales bacterium]
MKSLVLLLLTMGILKSPNIQTLRNDFPRVEKAAQNTQAQLKKLCAEKGLTLPLDKIFIRALKEEGVLEIWGANGGNFQLVTAYVICASSGHLGPKVRQGDRQVPEGWYQIDSINPKSEFHLSLRLNYPNKVDLVRSQNEKDPGGDIFIHGECSTVGCIPILNTPIEKVFWLVVQSLYTFPNQAVQVLILPFELNDEVKYNRNIALFPQYKNLWDELKEIHTYFDTYHQMPKVTLTDDGHYLLEDEK